jgi:hypothetical protein
MVIGSLREANRIVSSFLNLREPLVNVAHLDAYRDWIEMRWGESFRSYFGPSLRDPTAFSEFTKDLNGNLYITFFSLKLNDLR